ncbi:response regulator [Streptomyces canus]|uniref:response regulator n=1 Tax=Streptomyces canus TaxID=58343 RepID=UPI0038300C45
MAVRVLIAEDQAVVRQGLRDFLSLDGDIAVAGETTNGREAVRLARELCPDVVLMDLVMPVMDGIEATEQIRQELPEVRVVALTGALDGSAVMAAVRAGATGFRIGQQTVKTYVSHIFDKLGVHSRTQAVTHPLQLGLVPSGELARGLATTDEYWWSA